MEQEDEHVVHVYLINQYNEVLLRKVSSENNDLTIKDLTIQAMDIPSALREVEKQWGVLCCDDEFSHLYTIVDNGVTTHGYIIVIRLDPELISFITSHLGWKFYSFEEIRKRISPLLSPSTQRLMERLVEEA